MMRRHARAFLVMFTTGCLVSAQQANAQQAAVKTVFDRKPGSELEDMTLSPPSFTQGPSLPYASVSPDDTLSTYEIELEDEKDGNIYKEVAVVVIVVAFVAYMVKTLFLSEDDETDTSGGNIKPVPQFSVSVPPGR